jgi:hypothetical protein
MRHMLGARGSAEEQVGVGPGLRAGSEERRLATALGLASFAIYRAGKESSGWRNAPGAGRY